MCHLRTLHYTCPHRKTLHLSHCRGTFGRKPHNEDYYQRHFGEPSCKGHKPDKKSAISPLEIHLEQTCPACQSTAQKSAWMARLVEAREQVDERRKEWRKLLSFPHRAGVEKIDAKGREMRAAEGVVSELEAEKDRVEWESQKAAAQGYKDNEGMKRRRQGMVRLGSPLRWEVRSEDVVMKEKVRW